MKNDWVVECCGNGGYFQGCHCEICISRLSWANGLSLWRDLSVFILFKFWLVVIVLGTNMLKKKHGCCWLEWLKNMFSMGIVGRTEWGFGRKKKVLVGLSLKNEHCWWWFDAYCLKFGWCSVIDRGVYGNWLRCCSLFQPGCPAVVQTVPQARNSLWITLKVRFTLVWSVGHSVTMSL